MDVASALSHMDGTVVALLTWISALTGYEMPAAPPKIEFVSKQFLRDTMCEGKNCQVIAMYTYDDTVFLADGLDVENDVYHASILLHELVHYAQHKSGRFSKRDCPTWVTQEREAYVVQARWLRAQHVWLPVRNQMPRRDFCELAAAQSQQEPRPGAFTRPVTTPTMDVPDPHPPR